MHRNLKRGKLWLTEKKCLKKILVKFNMNNAKVISTLLAPHFKLSTTNYAMEIVKKSLMSKVSCESVMDSLMYLMVCIKPNLAYIIGKMKRYMSNLKNVN